MLDKHFPANKVLLLKDEDVGFISRHTVCTRPFGICRFRVWSF